MGQDRPDASNLLATVCAFLESLEPSLEGEARFHTRVSVHLLEIVRRELEQGAEADRVEREGLETLLGHPGELEALQRELAAAIREGRLDDDAVFAHVRAAIEAKLRIVNPRRL